MRIDIDQADIEAIASKVFEKLLPILQVQQSDNILVADKRCPKKNDLPIKKEVKSRMLSVREAAGYLGIAEKTLRNRLGPNAENPFPVKSKHIGGKVLFDVRDLDAYLDQLPTT